MYEGSYLLFTSIQAVQLRPRASPGRTGTDSGMRVQRVPLIGWRARLSVSEWMQAWAVRKTPTHGCRRSSDLAAEEEHSPAPKQRDFRARGALICREL